MSPVTHSSPGFIFLTTGMHRYCKYQWALNLCSYICLHSIFTHLISAGLFSPQMFSFDTCTGVGNPWAFHSCRTPPGAIDSWKQELEKSLGAATMWRRHFALCFIILAAIAGALSLSMVFQQGILFQFFDRASVIVKSCQTFGTLDNNLNNTSYNLLISRFIMYVLWLVHSFI